MQSSTQNIWVAQRDRGKDTMAIVKSEAPCADNARNNTARNRPSKACQPAKSTLGNFHAIPVFSLMSYLAFQSFLAVKLQLADLHAGQTNGGGPFLLVLRTNESAQALRGRVVEESLQDSLMACPLCNQYAAEPIQFTYVDMAICHTPPENLCGLAGTPGIWSKKFTTTPLPGNGDVFGVRMMTNDHWQKSSEFWRSPMDDLQGPFSEQKPHEIPFPQFNPREVYIFQSQQQTDFK